MTGAAIAPGDSCTYCEHPASDHWSDDGGCLFLGQPGAGPTYGSLCGCPGFAAEGEE